MCQYSKTRHGRGIGYNQRCWINIFLLAPAHRRMTPKVHHADCSIVYWCIFVLQQHLLCTMQHSALWTWVSCSYVSAHIGVYIIVSIYIYIYMYIYICTHAVRTWKTQYQLRKSGKYRCGIYIFYHFRYYLVCVIALSMYHCYFHRVNIISKKLYLKSDSVNKRR